MVLCVKRNKKQDARNKQITFTMDQTKTLARFDLEKRLTEFGRTVVRLCKPLPKDAINNRIISQLTGSSGSIGANYREANDALGKKDFLLRIRISRKEAKETLHWLELLEEANHKIKFEILILFQECTEIKNILSAIIIKVQNK